MDLEESSKNTNFKLFGFNLRLVQFGREKKMENKRQAEEESLKSQDPEAYARLQAARKGATDMMNRFDMGLKEMNSALVCDLSTPPIAILQLLRCLVSLLVIF